MPVQPDQPAPAAPVTYPLTIAAPAERDTVIAPAAYASGSVFGAARYSPNRSAIQNTTLDTRLEVDRASRVELMKVSRALYRNNAAWRRCVHGPAELVTGAKGLTPLPLTSDKEWNAAALDYFLGRAMSAETFDTAGKWNFADAQTGLLALRFKDGDAFPVLTESATGRAMFAFYEGHQCGDLPRQPPPAPGERPVFTDGVRTNRANRALAYQFVEPGGQSGQVIARENVVAFMDYETRGQNRGVTIGHCWFNDGRDVDDIDANLRQAIKAASVLGIYEHAGSAGAPQGQFNMATQGATTTTLSDGSQVQLQALTAGDRGQIAFTGGNKLDVIHDDRPHPNAMEYLQRKWRELAMSIGLPPDILFYLMGGRGAEVRLSVAGADCWVRKRQQRLIDLFCTRAWVYTVAKGMKAGDLPRCRDERWYKVGWIAPKKMTVDIGRDGALAVREYESRLMTLETWAGERATHWEIFQDQIEREAARGARRRREICAEEGVSVAESLAYRQDVAPPPPQLLKQP